MKSWIQLLRVARWPLVVLIVAIIIVSVFHQEISKLFDKDKVTISSKNFSFSFEDLDKVSQEDLEKSQKQLDQKSESDYTVEDWYASALVAYTDKRYEVALHNLEQALLLTETKEQAAKILFGRGVVLGRLERSEEAIAIYEEVVERYSQDTDPYIREQVAKSLLNKGVALERLERSEEAVAVYEEIVERYGQDTDPYIREQVARSLVNKGVAFGGLGRFEEMHAALRKAEIIFAELGLSEVVKEIKD